MAHAVDAEDQQAEGEARQEGGENVERAARVGGVRQVLFGEQERDHAQRHIDGEQDRPGGDAEQRGAERGAGGQRRGDHGGVEAEAAAELGAGIDRAHQRRLDRHDGRAAQPLHDAGRDQPGQRRRQRAAERGQAEEREAKAVDVAVAHDVGQCRDRQQADHQRDLARIDDPDRALGSDSQVLRDVGQREVGHRVAQH